MLNFNQIKLINLIPKRPFYILNLSNSYGTVSTKNYDERNDFDFDIVNFQFVDGDVPRRTSMVCSYINVFVSLEHLLTLVTLIAIK